MTSVSCSIAPESASPSRLNPADMTARGADLLASLIGFFRPTTSNAGITRLCASVEGQQLLQTLGNFINLVVDSGVNATTDAQEVMVISVNNMEEHLNAEYPSYETLPEELISIPAQEFSLLCNLVDLFPNDIALPTRLVEGVKERLFNSMPIRMLSFDSTGGSCTLVDRSALVDIILSRIRAFYPGRHDLRRELNRRTTGLRSILWRFCRYAILSHTWLRCIPGDVLFHDWANRELPQNIRGNSKIDNFCTIAARCHGVQLGWMDTVCINKESSSELDESIRSMYKWYQTAHVCIAYLADTLEFAEIPNDTWFTRGWTLQELVANMNIHFYNRDWTELQAPENFDAHLSHHDFVSVNAMFFAFAYSNTLSLEIQYQICKATTLTRQELLFLYWDPSRVPICRIMELAAMRMVTRAEDRVYSLMGLLNTSISIAYGEGPEQALKRMIQQIMISKETFQSLFNHTNTHSVLPSDITDYIGRSQMVNFPDYYPTIPISQSHLGVHGTFVAIPLFNKDAFKIPPNIFLSSIQDNSTAILETYIALNDSTDASEWISSIIFTHPPDTERLSEGLPVIFLALLMSKIDQDDDSFYLPIGTSLGVAVESKLLNRRHDTTTAQFADIHPTTFQWHGSFGPIEIELQYQEGIARSQCMIFTAEQAKRLGFRVISPCFR